MSQTSKATETLHQWFEDTSHHYSEFESSDVEYFIGVLLYNQFKFTLAVPTMKVMEIGLDFQSACGKKFNEVLNILSEIKFETDEEAVEFLLNYIKTSKEKYSKDECYLLDRIENHIKLLEGRYQTGDMPGSVSFEKKTNKYPF